VSFSDNEIKIVVSAANKASPIFKEIAKDSQAAFREIEQSSQTHNRTLNITRENYKEVRKELIENNRYLKTLKMSYQDQTQTLGLAADAFNKLGNVVGKAQTMYTQYNVAMIKTNQLQKEVKDAQEKYNEAVAKFGPDSQQARKAQEELAESTRKLADAQKQNTLQLIGFAAQMPSFLKGILDMRTSFMLLASQLKNTDIVGWARAGGAAISSMVSSATASLGSLIGTLGLVGMAIGTFIIGVQKHNEFVAQMSESYGLTYGEMGRLTIRARILGISVWELIDAVKAGKIELSKFGDEYVEIERKIRKTPVVPGTPAVPTVTAPNIVTPTDVSPTVSAVPTTIMPTTKLITAEEAKLFTPQQLYNVQSMKYWVEEYREQIDKLRDEYDFGNLSLSEYLQKVKALENKISILNRLINKESSSFDDLSDTMRQTGTVKSGLESNFGTLSGIMGQNIVTAGNLGSAFGNLGSQFQWANTMLSQFGSTQQTVMGYTQQAGNIQVPSAPGMPAALSSGAWSNLGKFATGAIQTAATAVTPMIQQLPKLANMASNMINVAANTAQTMVPAMLGMSNIPMVNKMLTGTMNMGILPSLPSLTNIVSSSVSPTFSNIGSSIVNSITGIGQSITNTLSSIFKPSVTAPPPLLPPTYEALQEGGIVTGPTWALLGEHGQREAVVPLPRGKLEAISEINVPISIRSLQVSNRREMTHFMREVERAIARESRYRSAIA